MQYSQDAGFLKKYVYLLLRRGNGIYTFIVFVYTDTMYTTVQAIYAIVILLLPLL